MNYLNVSCDDEDEDYLGSCIYVLAQWGVPKMSSLQFPPETHWKGS